MVTIPHITLVAWIHGLRIHATTGAAPGVWKVVRKQLKAPRGYTVVDALGYLLLCQQAVDAQYAELVAQYQERALGDNVIPFPVPYGAK